MGDYKKLAVWNKGMDLAVITYKLAEKLPKHELFALASQMKRASVSIPSNIAEGQARFSDREFIHFLQIARGSGAELETQLLLCTRLGYLQEQEIQTAHTQIQEIQRMIFALIQRIQDKQV